MMNRVKLLLPLLILIGNSIHSKGQQNIIPTTALQTPKEYYLQVKQFGEFIDRFNYKSDWKGNRITDEFARKVPRASYILYLMNSEDERLINPTDSSYRMLCSEFIAYVDNPSNPQAISLFSGQVKAIVKANITYNSKGHTASLEMIPEILPDRSAKWVISRVETDLFRFSPDSLQKHFIAPNSHETNFINLRKLNGTTNPYYYTSSVLTKTILFLKEVEQKRIIIQNTEKVTYYIHFSGWEITVEEFNRNSNNSGWLISDIKKR
jgi:hypothetical protein